MKLLERVALLDWKIQKFLKLFILILDLLEFKFIEGIRKINKKLLCIKAANNPISMHNSTGN